MIVVGNAVGSHEGRAGISDDYCASVVRRGESLRWVKMTYLDKYSHFHPDLLKLDVKGFEVEVLRGATTILKRAQAGHRGPRSVAAELRLLARRYLRTAPRRRLLLLAAARRAHSAGALRRRSD